MIFIHSYFTYQNYRAFSIWPVQQFQASIRTRRAHKTRQEMTREKYFSIASHQLLLSFLFFSLCLCVCARSLRSFFLFCRWSTGSFSTDLVQNAICNAVLVVKPSHAPERLLSEFSESAQDTCGGKARRVRAGEIKENKQKKKKDTERETKRKIGRRGEVDVKQY